MIPTWVDARNTNPELISEIVRAMKTRHFGRERAANKDELLKELFGITKASDDYEQIERTFRKCIEVANAEDGALIVSDVNAGYWWAASLDDGMVAASKHMNRALTMLGNAERLVDNLKKEYGGQLGLGL